MKKTIPAFGLMAALLIAGKAQATLIDRGSGLIYDDVLDITWTQTAGDGVARNWVDANTWAADLVYGGFSDWRLPSMDVNNDTAVVNCGSATEQACRDNEYGYMFYQNLNGDISDDKTGSQVGDGGVILNNIQALYWSGTGYDAFNAWDFLFNSGFPSIFRKDRSLYGWAVRPGDSVGVPEPGSAVLLGLGLLGLRLARRWRGHDLDSSKNWVTK